MEFIKPHSHGITLGRFFSRVEITNPTCIKLHLEDFLPLQKLETLPGWNCTWKIFFPWARITNPTGIEFRNPTQME
jgi:hypothetical protein